MDAYKEKLRKDIFIQKMSGRHHNGFVLPYDYFSRPEDEDSYDSAMKQLEDDGLFVSKLIGARLMISFNYTQDDINEIKRIIRRRNKDHIKRTLRLIRKQFHREQRELKDKLDRNKTDEISINATAAD